MADEVSVSLGGDTYDIKRSRLGKYLELLTQRDRLDEAVENGDSQKIASGLYEYLRISLLDLDRAIFESAPWFEIMQVFVKIADINTIPKADQYAIISVEDDGGKKSVDVPWTYPGRGVVVWKHLLASAYGWSLENIDSLWPEQAVEFLMEILSDELSDREFIHSLSEMAYDYDKTTKQSRYRPLRRPVWMVEGSKASQEIRKKSLVTKIRRDFLPVGLVIGPGPTEELNR